MAKLTIMRHGETVYNRQSRLASPDDTHLTSRGNAEAIAAGKFLESSEPGVAYVSPRINVRLTLSGLIAGGNSRPIPSLEDYSLIERQYGEFTGQSEREVKTKIGDEKYYALRNIGAYVLGEAEPLAHVRARISKFHDTRVMPRLESDENVLVITHHDPASEYIKLIENRPVDGLVDLHTGQARVYEYQSPGLFVLKAISAIADRE